MEEKFREFREYDKSLTQELGSMERSSLLPVSCWLSGIILTSYTSDNRFEYHALQKHLQKHLGKIQLLIPMVFYAYC